MVEAASLDLAFLAGKTALADPIDDRPLWMGTVACGMIASAATDALKQRLVERR
jgi:hypothetical protein